jgi:predicted SAM-dependent methyltransferase
MQRVFRIVGNLGTRLTCPCCGWRFRRFLPYGVNKRTNALCPKCGSRERHRLLWLYFKDRTDLFDKNHKVLHFAPEPIFERHFRTMPQLDYITADLSSSLASTKADITNIPCKDNSFDVVLCNHVLEHVPDDRRAMRELFRALAPGGWAIIQSPIDTRRAKTFEDHTIISPQGRERAFGQHNHVRIYGRDYRKRLENAGFRVKVDSYAEDLGEHTVSKHALKVEEIYFCTKPHRLDRGHSVPPA